MLTIVELSFFCVFAFVYIWVFYNLPILAAGIRDLRKKKKSPAQDSLEGKVLPSFSVILPVKNEQKVVGRLLETLSSLHYPTDKIEIVIVEDGSDDDTFEVCRQFANQRRNTKVFQRSFSDGKPSALNYGLKHCTGEIVAFFDADTIPDEDALLKVAKYFADPNVGAVQGRTLSINPKQNMLTQFISYEEAVWCEAYLRGKDVLNLFVHLKGSCQFIRRDVLEKLEGFDEVFLSDDMEISARLTETGHKIRYAPDVRAWQESPANLRVFFRQRTRWFRGTIEVAYKYGRLIKHINRKNLDAEATLFGPFILIASLLTYLTASGLLFINFPFNLAWGGLMGFSTLSTVLTLLLIGLALVYVSKPKKVSNLLWLPFVFSYLCLQAFIALYAASLIALHRPGKWMKTEKSGTATNFTHVTNTKRARIINLWLILERLKTETV